MKAAKTWCVASLLVAAFSLPSCGKDEANGNNEGGSGMELPTGGRAGTGNVAGGRTGGMGGMGGSGGSSSNVGATKLGRGCIADADCEDTKAPGLACVKATDTVLGSGAPPSGLCTAECASEEDCSALGAGALCYPFTADTSYCIEGCSFGMAELGDIKCHNRAEFACNPALLQDTAEPCMDTETDCQAGELCIEGTCAVVFPGCLPSCRGDIDCEAGMYCDQSFLSGVCVTEKPEGKGLGEPCTVPAEGEPSEPDGCLGFCQADAETGNAGHCATTCGLLNECGWNAETKKFDGACFYASILTAETGYVGDFGFCTPTCNCTEECNDPTLACSLLSQGALDDEFRGPGLCFSPDNETVEYNQCGTGGGDAGGAGGTGSAGAPSGEGGAGGAP